MTNKEEKLERILRELNKFPTKNGLAKHHMNSELEEKLNLISRA